mmetsp:Transcript_18001/g.56457  ORF Transcript_18001/g.56457 Transcript_18001/m.56457 type:complete len:124 (-) Transcript_18001:124-495(-)
MTSRSIADASRRDLLLQRRSRSIDRPPLLFHTSPRRFIGAPPLRDGIPKTAGLAGLLPSRSRGSHLPTERPTDRPNERTDDRTGGPPPSVASCSRPLRLDPRERLPLSHLIAARWLCPTAAFL